MALRRVQEILAKQFDIIARIYSRYNNGLRLYIAAESGAAFKKLIEPYVIPSMKYKLGEQMPKE